MFDWQTFLKKLSIELIADGEDHFTDKTKKSGWLGASGATEEQITAAETRLGTKLPHSYREFLKVSNGWKFSDFDEKLYPVAEIEWHYTRNQEIVDAWLSGASFYGEEPPLNMDEYLIYGDKLNDLLVPEEYLKAALEIGYRDDGHFLLNPKIVTSDGEWEAWYMASWIPGATRYPSFQAMMEGEYEMIFKLRDLSNEAFILPSRTTLPKRIILLQTLKMGSYFVETEKATHLSDYFRAITAVFTDVIQRIENLSEDKVADLLAVLESEYEQSQHRPAGRKLKEIIKVAQSEDGKEEGYRRVIQTIKRVLGLKYE